MNNIFGDCIPFQITILRPSDLIFDLFIVVGCNIIKLIEDIISKICVSDYWQICIVLGLAGIVDIDLLFGVAESSWPHIWNDAASHGSSHHVRHF